jgi:acetyl esterase
VNPALPPGRRRFTAMGYALRVVGALPRPVQRAVLGRALGGEPPAVPDLVRLLEAAGGMPEAGPTDAELFARFPELETVAVTEPGIDGPAGPVPARLYRRPDADADVALVWVHGGAFLDGTVAMAEAHWVGLALAARGIPVLSLDYRKALRGVRFPAAADDVHAGWRWAVAHADLLGVPAQRLHLGGASAGAALTAGLAHRLRDEAVPSPASVVLVYPLVHPELPAWDPDELAAIAGTPGATLFTPGWIRDLALHYAGTPVALADPYAFAATGEAAGLPPTFVLNCEVDSLRSSGEAYARRLADAGVAVTVQLEEGAEHGCLNEPFTPQAVHALQSMTDWLVKQG